MNARFPTSFHDAHRPHRAARSLIPRADTMHTKISCCLLSVSLISPTPLSATPPLALQVHNPLVVGLFQINQILDSSASSTPPFSSVVALVAVTETSLTATALTMVEVLLFLILM